MEEDIENSEAPAVTEEPESPIAGIGTMVFGKWDASEVVCNDPGISRYVNLKMIGAPTQEDVMRTRGSGNRTYQLLRGS